METYSEDNQSQSLSKLSDRPIKCSKNLSKELFICKICPSRMQERSLMRHFIDFHSEVNVKDIDQNIVKDFET
jgi:hypothetical protein